MKELGISFRALVRRKPPPDEQKVLKLGSDFHVLASPLASRRATRVLADGDSFAVFDSAGDIIESPLEALGFFYRDTRYLSRFELKVGGEAPYFLNSHVSDDRAQLRINLSNPDFAIDDVIKLPRNSIQIERDWVLAGDTIFHKVTLRNYACSTVEIPVDFLFTTDFADLFEVRGLKRPHGGEHYAPRLGPTNVRFSYRGCDGVRRFTEIVFDIQPLWIQPSRASFLFTLSPNDAAAAEVRVTCGCEHLALPNKTRPAGFDEALEQRRAEIAGFETGCSRITASNEAINFLLRRSAADLKSIIRHTREEIFIMAGIPWFATLFGRDSIITALFVLPFNPDIAIGTLKTLARLQGSKVNRRRDEEPGKIVHEIRSGELAATGEVPFGRYYGSVDSTPPLSVAVGTLCRDNGRPGAGEPAVEQR
jgi:glycogen debranching enzyme